MPLTLLLLFFFADPNLIIIAAEQLNRHELMTLEMLLRSSRMTGSRDLKLNINTTELRYAYF